MGRFLPSSWNEWGGSRLTHMASESQVPGFLRAEDTRVRPRERWAPLLAAGFSSLVSLTPWPSVPYRSSPHTFQSLSRVVFANSNNDNIGDLIQSSELVFKVGRRHHRSFIEEEAQRA